MKEEEEEEEYGDGEEGDGCPFDGCPFNGRPFNSLPFFLGVNRSVPPLPTFFHVPLSSTVGLPPPSLASRSFAASWEAR